MALSMPNPTVIQQGTSSRTPPLFLIHDGGGTVFNYFCLGYLDDDRTVYGISNPRFDEGGEWPGGIPAMAATYISLIQSVLPKGGPILLGGWSLGGILALEMSHQLAKAKAEAALGNPYGDPVNDIQIKGLILIDSVFPRGRFNAAAADAAAALESDRERHGAPDSKPVAMTTPTASNQRSASSRPIRTEAWYKAQTCMTSARQMLRTWQIPEFYPSAPNGNGGAIEPLPRPPAILFRATHQVPMGVEGKNPDVDFVRERAQLGWEDYETQAPQPFIRQVFNVQGDHYNLFDEPYVNPLTEALKKAVRILDT